MADCRDEQIDRVLPLGAETTKNFGPADPQALEFIPTTGLLPGTYLRYLHSNTNATLSYVLRPTANPGPEDGWGVTPDDFLLGVNEVYWSLEAVHLDGNPGIWNKDLDGTGGGWNIPQVLGAVNPQLNLDNAANRVVLLSDLI